MTTLLDEIVQHHTDKLEFFQFFEKGLEELKFLKAYDKAFMKLSYIRDYLYRQEEIEEGEQKIQYETLNKVIAIFIEEIEKEVGKEKCFVRLGIN